MHAIDYVLFNDSGENPMRRRIKNQFLRHIIYSLYIYVYIFFTIFRVYLQTNMIV